MRAALPLLAALLAAPSALAQAPSPAAPAPPPYSTPWLLRPAAAVTVLRLDSTLALYEDPATGAGGRTVVESLIVGYRWRPRVAPLLRLSWVSDDPPAAGARSGQAFSNPLVGLSYVRPAAGGWRYSLFGATTIPVGSGGGDAPDPRAAAAVARGIPARSGMENALFAVNYWTLVAGAGAARVTPRLTLQAEVTVLQLTRVRGPATQDGSRTNLTTGLHAGHFFSPRVSVGAELRMQRWLSDAAPVRANAAARDTVTASIGPRFHFRSGRRWIRPGIAYTRALDDPLAAQSYHMVTVDVPVTF